MDTKAVSLFQLRAIVVSLDLQATHSTQWAKHKPKLSEKSKQTFPTDSLQGKSYSDASSLTCFACIDISHKNPSAIWPGGNSLDTFLSIIF